MRRHVSDSRATSDNSTLELHGAGEVMSAFRAIRSGGFDDAGRAVELSRTVAGSMAAVLSACRWGAAMIGLAWAAPAAAAGDLALVATLAVAVFLASWRTFRPIRLGDSNQVQTAIAINDVAILSAAIGWSDGLTNPFVGSVLVAVAVVSFGWGLRAGIAAATTALVVTIAVDTIVNSTLSTPSPLGVLAVVAAAIFPGVGQYRLVHMEDRRQKMSRDLGRLRDTNELLGVLNDLARTLPSSLDLEDILQSAREQLTTTFRADRVLLLTHEDGRWSPQLQDGFELDPVLDDVELPEPLFTASTARTVIHVDDLMPLTGRTGSGLYGRLTVNGEDAGMVAVETFLPRQYSPTDIELLDGMTDVLALTIANARQFAQLRGLAAAEERTRIARDLHDRLGQWLTYIALELERINAGEPEPSADLKRLHEDTQGAIRELRDTLIELRASVTPERPLAMLLGEVVDRFQRRSEIDVTLALPKDRTLHLPAVVENELLRIAQEALTNVEKHAMASRAHVGWSIEGGRGILTIEDNGRGFTPGKGIRGTAYGLVGMRERAAAAGAILEVTSEPGQGTVITVLTSQLPREVTP
jgi:signal transduction histidine kinase